MEQGSTKGQQCWRPSQSKGYCGKHQKQATLELAKQNNQVKCKAYRCINILNTIDTSIVYCESCLEKKKIPSELLCKSVIECGPTKGTQCTRKATTNGFCGKHAPRQLLVQAALAQEKRICDDGKRACKNFTEDNKLLCEECLKKTRSYDNQRYSEKRESGNCLDCGTKLEEYISGLRDKKIQRCEKCYEKLRAVEEKRVREERNYKAERKKNTEPHYKLYKKGASLRNLWFELSIEQFTEIVNKPCFYCNTYIENEVVGIDRIDSELGYSPENCVSCCETCNFMKRDMNVKDFLTHISKIANTMMATETKLSTIQLTKAITEELKASHKSYIRPAKIVDLFMKQKLNEYITVCKVEKRPSAFITCLEKVSTQKMKRKEFGEYLKTLLRECE